MSSSREDQNLSEFQFHLLHSHSHFHNRNHNHNPTFSPFIQLASSADAHSDFAKLSMCQRYEINNFKPHTRNVEIAPSLSKIVNLASLQTEPGISGQHHGKSEVSRNAKSGTYSVRNQVPVGVNEESLL